MALIPSGCRACHAGLARVLDLGPCPQATAYPWPDDPRPDPAWRLELWMCRECRLVQLGPDSPEEPPPTEPPAPSSTIAQHREALADELGARGLLGGLVLELASHAGHIDALLAARGGSVVANRAADRDGMPLPDAVSFGRERAAAFVAAHGRASLVVDSYLFAHVADADDFVAGLSTALAPDGVAVLDLDHLLPLVEGRKFDAIRHGHFVYPSLIALQPLLERHGLRVRAAEPQPVYGGTLRVWLDRRLDRPPEPSVDAVLDRERDAGLDDVGGMEAFGAVVRDLCAAARDHLDGLRANGRVAAAYGAPSRGTTFVNVAGLDTGLLAFAVDRDPAKHGRCIPGPRIPIVPVATLAERSPDTLLVLTWDLRAEVIDTLTDYLDGGGRLVFAIPDLDVVTRPAGPRPASAHR